MVEDIPLLQKTLEVEARGESKEAAGLECRQLACTISGDCQRLNRLAGRIGMLRQVVWEFDCDLHGHFSLKPGLSLARTPGRANVFASDGGQVVRDAGANDSSADDDDFRGAHG
jgi:hypothetical protein